MHSKALFCKHHFPTLIRCTDQFSEEDLMLALEEYWHIVQDDPTCGPLNERIVRMIENPDSFSAADISNLHLEDEVLEKRISDYFGRKKCCSGVYQRQLNKFQKDDDSYSRGEFLQGVLFSFIIKVCQLRHLLGERVPVFEMPAQDLKVHINIEKETCPSKSLSLSLKVRKYRPFHMHLTLKQEHSEDIHLDINGMINHYYWNPVMRINIPSDYPKSKEECNLCDE